tara:strand:- start:513 stop:686 length:174 start_codon:yes stop_codon:yes gene_type:complete
MEKDLDFLSMSKGEVELYVDEGDYCSQDILHAWDHNKKQEEKIKELTSLLEKDRVGS